MRQHLKHAGSIATILGLLLQVGQPVLASSQPVLRPIQNPTTCQALSLHAASHGYQIASPLARIQMARASRNQERERMLQDIHAWVVHPDGIEQLPMGHLRVAHSFFKNIYQHHVMMDQSTDALLHRPFEFRAVMGDWRFWFTRRLYYEVDGRVIVLAHPMLSVFVDELSYKLLPMLREPYINRKTKSEQPVRAERPALKKRQIIRRGFLFAAQLLIVWSATAIGLWNVSRMVLPNADLPQIWTLVAVAMWIGLYLSYNDGGLIRLAAQFKSGDFFERFSAGYGVEKEVAKERLNSLFPLDLWRADAYRTMPKFETFSEGLFIGASRIFFICTIMASGRIPVWGVLIVIVQQLLFHPMTASVESYYRRFIQRDLPLRPFMRVSNLNWSPTPKRILISILSSWQSIRREMRLIFVGRVAIGASLIVIPAEWPIFQRVITEEWMHAVLGVWISLLLAMPFVKRGLVFRMERNERVRFSAA